jgi:hypothetical protein
MLKIVYKGENYNYGAVGKQPYDIDTEINIVEDATVPDVIQATIVAMKIAGYHIDRKVLVEAIDEALYEL